MHEGHSTWTELINAQDDWTTDDSMLDLIAEQDREFSSAPRWPRLKALAFLNNNVGSLRLNFERLESGESLDLDLINPIVESVQLRLADWRNGTGTDAAFRNAVRSGAVPSALVVVRQEEGWNRGTSALRFVMHRAIWHFAHYVDWRLRDPLYPGASPGVFRVVHCSLCARLTPSAEGTPKFCSEACASSRMEPA